MKNIISMAILSFAIMLCTTTLLSAKGKESEISSIKELAAAAAKSNQTIKMKAGVYQMGDYLTSGVIASAPVDGANRKAMILFSGNGNTFDLTGVTIEIDTRLLAKFKSSVNEIQITGNNNTIKGLTITDIGNIPPTGKGARSFVITGDNNTVDGITLNMSGSAPFGYGDLLGKGSNNVTPLQKHSGLLVEGLNINVLNCSIYSKSFGHLFFVQGGRNVLFENCYAEAVIRSTDEMLAEKSGPAFKVGFQSVYPNWNKEKIITPGYAKSLSECGFRNYGSGGPGKFKTGAMTVKNCRANGSRIGFAFTRIEGDVLIENCEAQNCEVGYSLTGAVVKSSRGDAKNGPLFNINKASEACDVELEVMPGVSTYKVHSLGVIAGAGHKLKISKYENKTRSKELPIIVGSGRPIANNGFSPFGDAAASGVEVYNTSGMPVILSSLSKNCKVTSSSKTTDNGTSNSVNKIQ